MSFGPKLDPLPAICSPNQEIVVTLQFVPGTEEFERKLTVYVEEPTGIGSLTITVKSAPHETAP